MNFIVNNYADLAREYKAIKNQEINIDFRSLFECAKLRDLECYNAITLKIPKRVVANPVQLLGLRFLWCSDDCGTNLAESVGLEHVKAISSCDKRIAFIENVISPYESTFSKELKFIADFIQTLVWLIPTDDRASFGNASFYQLPHCTFVSDASLFFTSPQNQYPRDMAGIAFIDNLYHEALHQQMHAHIAITNSRYLSCLIFEDEVTVACDSRSDRMFTISEALNALHVYRYLTPLRLKFLEIHKEDERKRIVLLDAILTSITMWRELSAELQKLSLFLSEYSCSLLRQWSGDLLEFTEQLRSNADVASYLLEK